MSIKVAIVAQTARTSTGTQDFTISGFGTPVAAIVRTYGNTSIGAWQNLLHGFCWAFYDGTNQYGAYGGLIAGNSSMAIGLHYTDPIKETGYGATGAASFNGWITDGVQLTYSAGFSAASYVEVTLIGGTDVQAFVGAFDRTADNQAVTGVGFQPNVLFMASTTYASTVTTSGSTSGYRPQFGIAARNTEDNTIYQYGVCNYTSYTTYNNSYISKGNYSVHATTALSYKNYISSFDSDGFTDTRSYGASAYACCFLALRFNNANIKLMDYDWGTSTGYHTCTCGFEAEWMWAYQSDCPAYDTFYNEASGYGECDCFAQETNSPRTASVYIVDRTSSPSSLVEDYYANTYQQLYDGYWNSSTRGARGNWAGIAGPAHFTATGFEGETTTAGQAYKNFILFVGAAEGRKLLVD